MMVLQGWRLAAVGPRQAPGIEVIGTGIGIVVGFVKKIFPDQQEFTKTQRIVNVFIVYNEYFEYVGYNGYKNEVYISW